MSHKRITTKFQASNMRIELTQVCLTQAPTRQRLLGVDDELLVWAGHLNLHKLGLQQARGHGDGVGCGVGPRLQGPRRPPCLLFGVGQDVGLEVGRLGEFLVAALELWNLSEFKRDNGDSMEGEEGEKKRKSEKRCGGEREKQNG